MMQLDDDGEYVDAEDWYKEDDEAIIILHEDDDDKIIDKKPRDQVGRVRNENRSRDLIPDDSHPNEGLY